MIEIPHAYNDATFTHAERTKVHGYKNKSKSKNKKNVFLCCCCAYDAVSDMMHAMQYTAFHY